MDFATFALLHASPAVLSESNSFLTRVQQTLLFSKRFSQAIVSDREDTVLEGPSCLDVSRPVGS